METEAPLATILKEKAIIMKIKGDAAMKKIITFILGVAVLFSCQQVDIDSNTEITSKPLKVTAYIDGNIETRMHYEVVTGTSNTITPTWENGDEIFGFDSNGDTFTFTVTRSGENEAELSVPSTYEPAAETKVYAIFAPGYSVESLSNNSLSVNLASQGGVLNPDANGIPFPALMCATGEVVASGENNEIELHFTNQTAIIGVKKFQLNGSTKSHTVTSMTLNGVITTGTFRVVNDNLVLVPDTETSSITATGTWDTEEDGIYEAGVYFAAMPATNAQMSLSASTASATYNHVSTVSAPSIVAGNYYYMSKKLSAEYVAQIGADKYSTINAAWAVANASPSDVTITLLADCAASAQLNLNSTGSGDITFDLNGYNLSTAYQMRVSSGRDLTITDSSTSTLDNQGAITSSYNSGGAIYVNGGNLRIEGGNISNPQIDKYVINTNGASNLSLSGGRVYAPSYSAAYIDTLTTIIASGAIIESGNRYAFYVDGGTLSITDGSVITNATDDSFRAIYNTNGGQVAISGGTFSSKAAAVIISDKSSSVVQISGGYFSSNNEDVELFTVSNNGKCYITGGLCDRAVNGNRTRAIDNTARQNTLNSSDETKDEYPFEITSGTRYFNVVKEGSSIEYWHATLGSAAKHACGARANVTISPRNNRTGLGAVTLNNPNYSITFDLNGKILSSTKASLLSLGGTVVITDSGSTKGSLSSSKFPVIRITSSNAEIELNGVTVFSSDDNTATSWNDDAVVNMDSSNGQLTIIDSKVYSTKHLSTFRGVNGTTTITNSELSSGIEGNGWYVLYAANLATINIVSGSFYTSGTGYSSTCHIGYNRAEINVTSGYFYSNGRAVSSGSKDYYNKLTLNGGYYNKEPSTPLSGTGQDQPNYGAGLSMQAITPTESFPHSIVSGLVCGYQVKAIE